MLSESNIRSLWAYVNQGVEFPWPRSQKGKEKLSKSISLLISDAGVESELNALDKNAFNLRIRELISPKLVEGKADQSAHIGKWIVRDWGGIRNGGEAISQWVEQLETFEASKIDKFVSDMGVRRVSSWSKILAFSDPVNHAIYDARTAVALNCGLHHLGIDWRFSMPLSQNRTMIAARPMLLPKIRGDERGYLEYIELLKVIAKACGFGNDILKVEMTLFANAPVIAKNFVETSEKA
jgi:hypothetical protein